MTKQERHNAYKLAYRRVKRFGWPICWAIDPINIRGVNSTTMAKNYPELALFSPRGKFFRGSWTQYMNFTNWHDTKVKKMRLLILTFCIIMTEPKEKKR